MIILHNAGGLDDRTGVQYIEALNKAGFATFELNLFPRGARPASAAINLPQTFGALMFLAQDPRIDADHIGVMGFSWGGILSMVSASSALTKAYTGGKIRYAAHLPLYPACSAHQSLIEGKNRNYPSDIYHAFNGAPVHILAGEKDDYDDPDSCAKIIASFPEAAREHIKLTVYPGVGHGWDTREDRQYQDAISHKGRGGYVRHFRDDETAKKSTAFAVEFFNTTLR